MVPVAEVAEPPRDLAAPSDDLLLRADGLAYAYPNGTEAVARFDLDLKPGEVVSIVGPSGCGKSTLLGMLAGLHAPAAGRIAWNEALLRRDGGEQRRPTRRRLTLVFQKDTLFPWRNVEDNITFGLDYLAISAAERAERLGRLLDLARMRPFRKAYPHELSGGMRRRVAVLTGVAPLPHLLLLDEPFTALDEPTRVGVHADLLQIVYELKLAVVLVTHDLAEAITLSDRIIVMSNRPARIAWSIDTKLGRDRDILRLRTTPEYAALYAATWEQLWRSIGQAPASHAG